VQDTSNDRLYRAIQVRRKRPWWTHSAVMIPGGAFVGTVVAAVAMSVIAGASSGGSSNSTDSPSPSPSALVQSQNNPAQNNQPVGITPAQKSQILFKFCTSQAGGPYNVSEAAYLQCTGNYMVTDQGMIMPK
jgi:hypothetical protein